MATKKRIRPKRHERQLNRPADEAVARAVAVMVARKRQRPGDDLAERIHKAGGSNRSSRTYREALDMLAAAVRRTRIADPAATCGIAQYPGEGRYLFALAQIALRFDAWRRPPATWACRDRNPRRQFASLVRHVLCDYNPPLCLDAAWFNPGATGDRERYWFVALGLGESVRPTFRSRFNLTRAAAHLLSDAPRSMTVYHALYWAHYRSMGASPALAERIIAAQCARRERNQAFRDDVAAWLIRTPGVRPSQVRIIFDYLFHRRFTPVYQRDGDDYRYEIAEPNLSMQGRTLASVMRQVNRWDGRDYELSGYESPRRWGPCGVPGFERIEGAVNPDRWIIQELRSSEELTKEGHVMNHCVGSYVSECFRRESAIYSLSRGKRNRRHRRATIEVDPKERKIVQVQRRSNFDPTAEDMRIIHEWADTVELSICEDIETR